MDAEMPMQQERIHPGSFTTSLTPQQFYQGDPWLVFVKEKLHLDNIWSTVIFFVSSILFNFSYTTFLLKDLHPTASLHDALILLLLSVAFTSAYFIYLLLPTFMADTFDTLRVNGIIGAYRQHSSQSISYEDFMENLLVWANSRWWLALLALMNVLVWLQNVLVERRQIPLFWNVLSYLVGGVPGIYIVGFTLVRVVLMLVFINRLFFLFTIQVKPLHSDGSGGLGSLGHIGWISVGMILAISLMVLVVTRRLAGPVDIIILTASYGVSVLVTVVAWLA